MKKNILRSFKIKKQKRLFLKEKRAFIHKSASIDEETKLGFDVFLGIGDYRGTIIGDYSYIGSGIFHKCKVGKFTSIGQNVFVISGSHPINRVSSSPAFIKSSTSLMKRRFHQQPFDEYIFTKNGFESEIGNDVWIGNNVLIKGGITIGDGAVVGMGSIVTRDVPPYAIVGGNPAKIIRFRFDDRTITSLLEIKWWNFDESSLDLYSPLFNNVEDFINTFQSNNKKTKL